MKLTLLGLGLEAFFHVTRNLCWYLLRSLLCLKTENFLLIFIWLLTFGSSSAPIKQKQQGVWFGLLSFYSKLRMYSRFLLFILINVPSIWLSFIRNDQTNPCSWTIHASKSRNAVNGRRVWSCSVSNQLNLMGKLQLSMENN